MSTNSFTTNYGNPTLVPELDAKLGAMYSYMTPHGALSIDAGWMWAYYNRALRAFQDSGNIVSDTFSPEDWGVQGLYVGVKYIGNIA